MFSMEIELHGMTVSEAKQKIERTLATLPPHIKEVTLIHGYRQGNALQNMIRKDLKSKKIKQKILSLNQGVTTLIIA